MSKRIRFFVGGILGDETAAQAIETMRSAVEARMPGLRLSDREIYRVDFVVGERTHRAEIGQSLDSYPDAGLVAAIFHGLLDGEETFRPGHMSAT